MPLSFTLDSGSKEALYLLKNTMDTFTTGLQMMTEKLGGDLSDSLKAATGEGTKLQTVTEGSADASKQTVEHTRNLKAEIEEVYRVTDQINTLKERSSTIDKEMQSSTEATVKLLQEKNALSYKLVNGEPTAMVTPLGDFRGGSLEEMLSDDTQRGQVAQSLAESELDTKTDSLIETLKTKAGDLGVTGLQGGGSLGLSVPKLVSQLGETSGLGAVVPGALAAWGAIQAGGQTYQDFQNTGNMAAGGAGAGMMYQGMATSMALSPFVTSGQAKEYMNAALSEGFKGDEVDTVMGYMEENYRKFGMKTRDSVELLQSASDIGGQSLESLSSTLTLLKDTSKDAEYSLGAATSSMTKMTKQITGQGGSGQLATGASVYTNAIFNDSRLKDKGADIGSSLLANEDLQELTAQNEGAGTPAQLLESLGNDSQAYVETEMEALRKQLESTGIKRGMSSKEIMNSPNRLGESAFAILNKFGANVKTKEEAAIAAEIVMNEKGETAAVEKVNEERSTPTKLSGAAGFETSGILGATVGTVKNVALTSIPPMVKAWNQIESFFTGDDKTKEIAAQEDREANLFKEIPQMWKLATNSNYRNYGALPSTLEKLQSKDSKVRDRAIEEISQGNLGPTPQGRAVTVSDLQKFYKSQSVSIQLGLKGNADKLFYTWMKQQEVESGSSTGAIERNSVTTFK